MRTIACKYVETKKKTHFSTVLSHDMRENTILGSGEGGGGGGGGGGGAGIVIYFSLVYFRQTQNPFQPDSPVGLKPYPFVAHAHNLYNFC